MLPGLLAYGVICFIGVIFFTFYLLWRFARPGSAGPVLALTFLSWLTVFSISFLVPIDLFPDAENSLDDVWSVLFWASFLLMWFIIPFASGYYDNGGFTVKQKVWMSLKFNGILLLVALVLSLAGIIYLTASADWSMDDVSGLLVCLSNTWGLTMLVLCAGFGLVEFPRSIYHMGQYKRRTELIYFNASYIQHEAEETRDELGATIALLNVVEKKIDDAANEKHRQWLVEIRNVVRVRELEMDQCKYKPHPFDFGLADDLKAAEKISTNQMFRLHHHAKTLVRHLSLVETQWRDTVDDAVLLEAELKAQADPHQLSWWLKTGQKRSYTVMAIACSILSALLIFGEITITASSNVSPLAWIVQAVEGNFIAQQIWTVIPLLYLSACTYYPLFQLRLSKLYYIGRRRTDEGTLLFNATFILRVATPLAYNFVLLLRIPARSLEKLIGVVTVIPFFGTSFTTIFPVFIAVLNVLVFFNVFARVGAFLGIQSMKFSVVDRLMDEDIRSQIQEGRTLIQNELRKREREIRANRAIIMGGSENIGGKKKENKIEMTTAKPNKAKAPVAAAAVEDFIEDSPEPEEEEGYEEEGSEIHDESFALSPTKSPGFSHAYNSSDGGFPVLNHSHDSADDLEAGGFSFDQRQVEEEFARYRLGGDDGEYDEDGNLI